jgi:uncharacterized protein (DUF58 family)
LPWLSRARLTLIIMNLQIATVFDFATALIVLFVTVALAGLIVVGPVRRATRINAGKSSATCSDNDRLQPSVMSREPDVVGAGSP